MSPYLPGLSPVMSGSVAGPSARKCRRFNRSPIRTCADLESCQARKDSMKNTAASACLAVSVRQRCCELEHGKDRQTEENSTGEGHEESGYDLKRRCEGCDPMDVEVAVLGRQKVERPGDVLSVGGREIGRATV